MRDGDATARRGILFIVLIIFINLFIFIIFIVLIRYVSCFFRRIAYTCLLPCSCPTPPRSLRPYEASGGVAPHDATCSTLAMRPSP